MKITSTVTRETEEVFVLIERNNYKLLLLALQGKNIRLAPNLKPENIAKQFGKVSINCVGVARINFKDNAADWYSVMPKDYKVVSLNDLVDLLGGQGQKSTLTIETENAKETEAVKNFVEGYSEN